MSEEAVGVTIRVLDKDYRIACPLNEQEDLMDSARLLDSRMREIRQTGRVIGSDRIAVMAALNLTHELLKLRRDGGIGAGEALGRLARIQRQVAAALSGDSPLDASEKRV